MSEDPARAVEAFSAAAEEQPSGWAAHYFLALAYLEDDPKLAQHELDVAIELNPLSQRLRPLEKRIRKQQALSRRR